MASEERKEAFLRAWFDAPEGSHWAHGMSNEIEQNVSDCFDKAIAAWATPVAPVSPDATSKCGELETVGYAPSEYGIGLDYQQLGVSRLYPKSCASGAVAVVTRSQAVELLAAERARAAEKERLRFEGDLDKWMKIIGAGITGYQPEAYTLMDLACEELVKLRADNAALTARVKELADELISVKNWIDTEPIPAIKALEAKLAAAERALEFYRDGFKYHPKRTSTGINVSEWKPTQTLLDDCGETARAALGGKQS